MIASRFSRRGRMLAVFGAALSLIISVDVFAQRGGGRGGGSHGGRSAGRSFGGGSRGARMPSMSRSMSRPSASRSMGRPPASGSMSRPTMSRPAPSRSMSSMSRPSAGRSAPSRSVGRPSAMSSAPQRQAMARPSSSRPMSGRPVMGSPTARTQPQSFAQAARPSSPRPAAKSAPRSAPSAQRSAPSTMRQPAARSASKPTTSRPTATRQAPSSPVKRSPAASSQRSATRQSPGSQAKQSSAPGQQRAATRQPTSATRQAPRGSTADRDPGQLGKSATRQGTAASDWNRRVGPAQKLPTGATADRGRTAGRSGQGDATRKDLSPGVRSPIDGDRQGVTGGRNGNGDWPSFSFYRDDDNDVLAGGIHWGDKGDGHGGHWGHGGHGGHGDRWYGGGYHHRPYYNHWVWGGGCRYGYRYPYWGGWGYPYYGYRNCPPYYSSIYSPYYYGWYDPWYYAPSYGYGYVSVYYSDPAPVVYESAPVVYESYEPAYQAPASEVYVDTYDSYAAPPADSTVIYEREQIDDGGPTIIEGYRDEPRSYSQPRAAPPQPQLTQPQPQTEVMPPPSGTSAPSEVVPQAAAPAGAEQGQGNSGWGPILSQGNEAFSAGKYDEAARHYARAVIEDPKDGYARMLSAWATFAMRDYAGTAASIRAGLDVTPELAEFPIDVRILYSDPSAFEAQIEQLQGVVMDRPDDRDAAFVLAYLHYSIGEPDKSLALLDRLGAESDPLVAKLRTGAVRGQEILKQREQKQQPAPPSRGGQ